MLVEVFAEGKGNIEWVVRNTSDNHTVIEMSTVIVMSISSLIVMFVSVYINT